MNTPIENSTREQTMERLYGLLELQKKAEEQFGDSGYNVFVFGSYLTTRYVKGQSDIDIAVYTEFRRAVCLKKPAMQIFRRIVLIL